MKIYQRVFGQEGKGAGEAKGNAASIHGLLGEPFETGETFC